MASTKITLFALLFLTIFTYSKAKLGHLKETEMTLYYKDYVRGPNANTIEIPGPSTGPLNFSRFGATFVSDDPISKEIEEGSATIARGQGLYVITDLDGSHGLWLASVVFIKDEYEGSTLELQGSYSTFGGVTEVAVVGGTGKFRLARGYATYESLSFDPVSGYSVFQSNMTVLHY